MTARRACKIAHVGSGLWVQPNENWDWRKCADQGKKCIICEHRGVEKCEQGEEDRPQEELIKVVVPRVNPIAEDVISLSYSKEQLSAIPRRELMGE